MLEPMFVIDSIPHIQDDCKYSLEHLFFFHENPLSARPSCMAAKNIINSLKNSALFSSPSAYILIYKSGEAAAASHASMCALPAGGAGD